MEFIFITNQPELASYAESVGVDRIMVDVEIIGKAERQGHVDSLISDHTLDDVKRLRGAIKRSKLQVRVNPIYADSKMEIDRAILYGADIIMLPMFKTPHEVKEFISIVNGRAIISLLLETPQALVRVDDILDCNGIDEIHIGLNDLHLGMGLKFMFELLSGGVIEYLSKKIKRRNVRFGFGGIAKIGGGSLDPRLILSEHVRLGSEMVILSRSFHSGAKTAKELQENDFEGEVNRIREYLAQLKRSPHEVLQKNKIMLHKLVNSIVYSK